MPEIYKIKKGDSLIAKYSDGGLSKMGYRRDSPYKNRSSIDIKSNNISMNNVDFPILGTSLETGEQKIMLPMNNYNFDNTKTVRETPFNRMQNGGNTTSNVSEHNILSAYLPTLSKQQQDLFIDAYENMPPANKRLVLKRITEDVIMKKSGKIMSSDHEEMTEPYDNATEESKEYKKGGKTKGKWPQWLVVQNIKKGYFKKNKKQDGGEIPEYPEVPEDIATTEVEKGETMLDPQGQLTQFGGKPHSEGGTPVNLDAGSKIFSEYLKVPSEVIKQVTGKDSKDKISFAKLSKKYPTEKFRNILRDKDSDEYEKETARISLLKHQAILETLFTGQELMKEKNNNSQYMQDGGVSTSDPTTLYDFSDISSRFQDFGYNLVLDPITNMRLTRDNETGLYRVPPGNNERNSIGSYVKNRNPNLDDYYLAGRNNINKNAKVSASPAYMVPPRQSREQTNQSNYDWNSLGLSPQVLGRTINNDDLGAFPTPTNISNTVKGNSRIPEGYKLSANKPLFKDTPYTDSFETLDQGVLRDPITGKTYIRYTDNGGLGLAKGSYLEIEKGQGDLNPIGSTTPLDIVMPTKNSKTIPPITTGGKGKVKITGKSNSPSVVPVTSNTAVDTIPPTNPIPNFDPISGTYQSNSRSGVPDINSIVQTIPTDTQVKQQSKKSWWDNNKDKFGINSKLAGTILDIGLTASDHLDINSPVLNDRRKTPIFNRFYEFDDKEAQKMFSTQVQQINNSNLPEQVKQAQIAAITANASDYQGKVDFANAQRYEQKRDVDLNKLQSYMDTNIETKVQDLDAYRQKKAKVDYLKNRFQGEQKAKIYNSVRNYLDYTDELNVTNQLSDHYTIDPITGRLKVKKEQNTLLKDNLLQQYAQQQNNTKTLPNGATATQIGNLLIVTGPDGKSEIKELKQ